MRRIALILSILLIASPVFGGFGYQIVSPPIQASAAWTPASATTSGGVTAVHWYSPSHSNFQDSARTTAVASDGDVTGSATDNMVSADHVSQATTDNKPIYKTNILGTKPMWLLNGSSHYFRGAFTTGGAITQPFTVIAVATLDATVVNDHDAHVLFDGDDAINRALVYKDTTNPDPWTFYAGTGVAGGAADATSNVWAAVFNGASSVLYQNGVSEAAGNAGTKGIDGLTVAATDQTLSYWKGYVGDIIIYPGALTTADLNQVGAWLAAFYGLTWTPIASADDDPLKQPFYYADDYETEWRKAG